MKATKIVIAIVFAAFVLSSANALTCDFEDLVLGTTYDVNSTMTTNGQTFEFEAFEWDSGIWYVGGSAQVQDGDYANGSGQELAINNINIMALYGSPVPYVEFLFGEYGGNLNLAINGYFMNFQDFDEADGWNLGGCSITVIGGAQNVPGSFRAEGSITQFVVGGQELWIDNYQIPEPATLVLVGLGTIGLRRRTA